MGNSKRVVVGMSGGVDSAVAAYLLREQGYEVIGVFMRNWEEEDDTGTCTADEDFDYVRRVCTQLNIPYYTVNFVRQYWDRVFTYFLDEYRRGRTPNPDVMCNKEIKFAAFLDFAMTLDADYLATGHYARIRKDGDGFALVKGRDAGKDQSYFLHVLGQKELSKTLFPVGDMPKSQVRAIAEQLGLANARRKDSTGICFIGERNFRAFLSQFLPAQPGDIVEMNSGRRLGRHDGLMYYTLGQRKGLGIGGVGTAEPWFVVEKDLQKNQLVVVQGKDHPRLYSFGCTVEHLHYVGGKLEQEPFACMAKFRYRQGDQPVKVFPVGDGCRIVFDTPQRAVTPGQFAVLYLGDDCLGGGAIEEVFPNPNINIDFRY